ncbi:MAG: hypothetical protein ACOYL5_13985 [Phototrophicaceae bacterium]|jgi:hypothetical protein
MPATVEKVPDQPIAIIRYYGQITAEDAKAVFAQVAALLDLYGQPLYRITTVDEDDNAISIDEIKRLTVLSSQHLPGSVTDPKIFTVLVGQHLLIDLYVDAMQQKAFGGVEIPLFDSLEDALQYVQEEIAANRDATPSAH